MTAQRLIIERRDLQPKTVRFIADELKRRMFMGLKHVPHYLWTLHGLGLHSDEMVQEALKSRHPEDRVHALAVAAIGIDKLPEVKQLLPQLWDPDPKVRHQLALTLGSVAVEGRVAALAKIAAADVSDPWTQTAVLAGVPNDSAALLDQCLQQPAFVKQPLPAHGAFLAKLAQLTGASASESDLARLLPRLLEKKDGGVAPWQLAVLQSVGAGLAQRGRTLDQLWQQPALKATHAELQGIFTKTAAVAKDDKQPLGERIAAVKLISYGPFDLLAANVTDLLTPAQPQELQLAAVRALSTPSNAKVGPLLIAPWSGYSPTVRREVTEALLARPERVRALLDAIAAKKVLPLQLEPARLDQLRKHPQKALRDRAVKLLAGQVAPARQKVLEDYKGVLEMTGNPAMGKALFKKVCATCHKLENVGVEVGADLQAALGNKTPNQLLIDILDPSREVDPRFLEYAVTTVAGKQVNGLIVAETASSLTLRRAEKQEETILRSQIDTILTTTKSLMPDGLEQQLSRQDVADVIAYLQAVSGRK
jgi:putative heme-binding domain-containing protein